MNYAQTAQNLAAQGRYGDTTLVHMTPQEVGGLQALARSQGTSLTTNPSTGLPEAFNLRGFLPALAGAGLAMIPGLNMNPLTIGLLTGGLGAAMTGDIRKGLMIGLGAAGGAGLAGSAGLTGASASGASGAAGMGGATGSGITAAPPPIDAGTAFTAGPGSGGAGFSLKNVGSKAVSELGSKLGSDAYSLVSPTASGGIAPSATSTALTPKFAPSIMDTLSANKSTVGMAAAPILASGLQQPGLSPLDSATFRPYDLTVENLSGQDPYSPGSTREREQIRYTFTPRPITTDPNKSLAFRGTDMSPLLAADGGLMELGDDNEPVEMMSGGLAAFKQGQYLQGGGDGMSDSIPAVIANRQPARLADGEFIVPADVVSGLGNGSSNAGAKQLYGMMDRVRQGRTGKKKQAPEIKPTKYMPA